MARSRGWQGRAEIEVTLDDKGSLLSAAIVRSSGHQLLDRVALQWARHCDYSAPPVVAGSVATANVPVTFRLRGVSTGDFMVKTQ
jgi:TonB family protein